MGDYAYLGRWNYKLNKPALGEEWISEDAARQMYEAQQGKFDVVPLAIADGQGGEPRPVPPWVLTAYAKGPLAFRVTFVNPVGSIWRMIDYKDVDGRLFKWVVVDYSYPDTTSRYRLDQNTMVVDGSFNPDGTGSLTINDKSKPTVDRLSMDQVDISKHWMDRPPFGAWEQLTDPEFGTTPSA